MAKRQVRPKVRDGSISTELDGSRYVRFPPDSDRIADIPDWQLRANKRLVRRSQRPPYSITQSAPRRMDSGIVNPIAFAVFKLITSSNFVGC